MLAGRAALLAVVAALAVPAVAQSATRTVWMGIPPDAQKTFEERLKSEVNDFFPHRTTIRVGDTVAFTPAGLHNVDIPPPGGRGLPAIAPTGQKAAGVVDAAGAPFWFNGQDLFGFSPPMLQSQFGRSLDYDGSERVNSGLPLEERPRPMRVRFRRAGLVEYLCDLHPGMKGEIRVRRRGQAIPSPRAHARAIRAQIARDKRVARSLRRASTPAGVVDVGKAGRYGVEYFDFKPKTRTVPVGTTLRFRMTPRTYETHSATTGPGDPGREPQSYLGQLTASLEQPAFSPIATYPSDPPPNPASLTPTSHGNGFWNSGFMDLVNESPLPPSNSVTFSAAGTYRFWCLIHPNMTGTVTAR